MNNMWLIIGHLCCGDTLICDLMHIVDGSCDANDINSTDLLWLYEPVIVCVLLWPAPDRSGDTYISTFSFDIHPVIPWYTT